MHNSILQFVENIIPEIQKRVKKQIINQEDIGQISKGLHNDLLNLGVNLLEEYIEDLDNELRKSQSRKKTHQIVNTQPNSLLTCMGKLNYERTCFKNKKDGSCEFLVDTVLGITPHEVLASDVEEKMLEESLETSYRKSGENATNTSDVVSKQTTKNLIDQYRFEFPEVKNKFKEKRSKKILYIEADEDHVASQTGGIIMPRLVYVHEGIKKASFESKRYELINTWYFSSTMGSSYNLWQDVHDYINNTYHWDDIETIYLSGDGAGWIKSGMNVIGKTKFVLDRYHMNKYAKKACAHMEDDLKQKLRDSLKEADREYMDELFEEIIEKTEEETRLKSVMDARRYFRSNWDGIKVYVEDGYDVVGCSAESHISHIYSARFSSRPKGWSKRNVDTLAKMIVYKRNGGKVIDLVKMKRDNDFNELNEIRKEKNKSKNINGIAAKRSVKEYYNNAGWENILNGKQTKLVSALKGLRGIV